LRLKIIFPTGNIVYFYNASGQKVQKVVTENITVTTTDYLGGYQYIKKTASEPVELQFFPTAEGYVKNTPVSGINTYSYVYNYKDHLGNTRLSYTKDTATGSLKILEENNYYPFGLKHNSYNVDNFQPEFKYQYNGKELQDELGLNQYDYGARNYDPALGRWMNIDPLAETSRRFSPYAYALNNPVFFIDPDGMQATYNWEEHNKGNKGVYTDGDKNVSYETALSQVGVDIHPDRAAKEGEYHHDDNDNTTYRGNSDGTWTQATELNEVKVKGYKSPSYFQGYFDGPNSGEYGPSSMNPDASGISVNIHLNTGIIGELSLNGGVAFNRNNNFAFFGSYGGNFGYSSRLGIPTLGVGVVFDSHYNYGGNKDVLGGLGGRNKGYFVGYGLAGSISESARLTANGGYINENTGVRTVSFGLGSLSVGTSISRGGVWNPFK
jgi:RHS repeat-associated protein